MPIILIYIYPIVCRCVTLFATTIMIASRAPKQRVRYHQSLNIANNGL